MGIVKTVLKHLDYRNDISNVQNIGSHFLKSERPRLSLAVPMAYHGLKNLIRGAGLGYVAGFGSALLLSGDIEIAHDVATSAAPYGVAFDVAQTAVQTALWVRSGQQNIVPSETPDMNRE